MVTIVPAKKKSQRTKIRPATIPPGPAALVLVEASYESFSVTLTFDRAIDLSAFNPAAIFVSDGERSMQLQGGGEFGMPDENTVSASMGEIGDYEGGDTVLQAGADSGIVAVDDGGTWSGTSGMGLPFP